MLVEHSPLWCRVMFVQDQVCTLMQCRKFRLLEGSELKHSSSSIFSNPQHFIINNVNKVMRLSFHCRSSDP